MRFFFSIGRLSRVVLALCLVLTVFSTKTSPAVQAQGQVILRKFDMLSASSGWTLLDQHLFWTSDAGQTWSEISPTPPTDAVIQDVKFIDTDNGWVLLTVSNPDGGLNFQLAHTTNNGKTWTMNPLPLFQTGEIASFAEKAEMGWFDSQTGWISVKQNSGSNFSIGTLFTTSDGGLSWKRFDLPIADKLYFSDPQYGWAIGGDQIFSTSDGGVTWTKIVLPNISNDIQATIYPPFILNGRGLLIASTFGSENTLNVYSPGESNQWSSIGQVKLDAQPGQLGLSILDSQSFVATIPGTASIVRMENDKLTVLKNEDGLSASIVSLDMISLEDGWAESIDSNCITASSSDRESASVSCSSTNRLLRTDNGGVTWQAVNLPNVPSGVAALNSGSTVTSSTVAASGNTALFTGQGFDACEIPTLSQMQTWSQSSPYKVVNLYIGGSSRACNNSALISSYLFLLHQQGWDFIPTWVGPQAPCTGFPSRMSSDVNTAYTQGVNEANLAVDRLAQLGLTGPDKTGSVIYYDIENYGTNAACRSAVNAFMNGWVSQIHALASIAGVYGSTLCNTGLSDFLNIANVPDVMWAARWYHSLGQGYYDPNASVWNLGNCIPNTAWADHQRVRQYEGDHNETWGNLTLEIDSDVLDGVVAVPYDYPYVSSITRKDANPTQASVVNFTVTFSKSVTGVNAADFKLTTTGVTGASISSVNGSATTYTVAVNTGTGDGTIRLDLLDNDSIKDATNTSIGGAGAGNGNFTFGETYTITKPVNINVEIGSNPMGDYEVLPSNSLRLSYAGVDSGPLKVESSGKPVVASLRDLWSDGTKPSSSVQVMGLPASQLSSKYVFPAYNNVSLDDQLRFGNVGTATTTVTVTIGGVFEGSYSLNPSESTRVNYPGVDSGPVVVQSSGNVPIIASIRDSWSDGSTWSSYAQLMGLPGSQLSSTYFFPAYNNVSLDDQLRFGNVGTKTTTVTVTIGGVVRGSYALAPDQSTRVYYPGVDSGPVIVQSSGGVPIIASIRDSWWDGSKWSSYFQLMGLPGSLLSNTYVFPIYDNVNVDAQLRVGNVGTTTTAVTVSIAGVAKGTYTLDANQSFRVYYSGINAGPMVVQSSGGIPIIASIRDSLWDGSTWSSYSQLMGLPASQLSTIYLFPAYNNVTYDNELRIAVP